MGNPGKRTRFIFCQLDFSLTFHRWKNLMKNSYRLQVPIAAVSTQILRSRIKPKQTSADNKAKVKTSKCNSRIFSVILTLYTAMRLTIAGQFRASFALFSDKNSKRALTDYKWFLPFQSRWLDNDRYGHMNNAVYHGIFDSVINIYLIRKCGLDTNTDNSSTVGFMVNEYFSEKT